SSSTLKTTAGDIVCALTGCEEALCCDVNAPTFEDEFVMGTAGQSCEEVCSGRAQVCDVDNTVSMIRAAWAAGGSANAVVSVIEENGGVCPNGANNQDYYSLPGVGTGNCEISNNYGTADGSVMFNCLGKFDTVERLCFCNG
ncbi:hypothetical protein SARC_17497, partial [Sphaeroforma arctica JP610]